MKISCFSIYTVPSISPISKTKRPMSTYSNYWKYPQNSASLIYNHASTTRKISIFIFPSTQQLFLISRYTKDYKSKIIISILKKNQSSIHGQPPKKKNNKFLLDSTKLQKSSSIKIFVMVIQYGFFIWSQDHL
jgi:hypothetical protein